MDSRDPDGICQIILFGGSGDLAMRMLFPALYFLELDGLLPQGMRILSTARSEMSDEDFIARVRDKFQNFRPNDLIDEAAWRRFAARIRYVPLDVSEPGSFERLAERVREKPCHDLVHYLATSPSLYGPICEGLGRAGLSGGMSRVVMEKPIGHDLASSREINEAVARTFPEKRIFRVDHYLGKETVQNLLALRFGNSLFEPLWNSRGIDHVQITVGETVGVEGRWSYYDGMGALRDMVQNHLLQLICLVAMEPPSNLDPEAVRNEKVKVLRSLRPFSQSDVTNKTVRGQYTAGVIAGREVPGYAGEEGSSASDTETFVALRADIDNWRWAGVPFYLRTGKRLPSRSSEIFIQFRPVPHSIFSPNGPQELEPNKLIIRLQPEENIRLLMLNKVPGLGEGMTLKELALNLSLTDTFSNQRRRIAYERLLLDVIKGDSTLFVRRDEIEAAWEWIDGIVKGWKTSDTAPKPYAAGTWGPSSAVRLTERDNHTWHEQSV